MKRIVINADDFGYRDGINKGIIYAHKNGLVTSASLFVEKEGSEDAIRLAKENPSLGLGPHIDLDKFFEIDHSRGSFVNLLNKNYNDIEAEARRQIDKFLSLGFTPDHLNTHHHTHLHSDIFPIICKVAKEYKIPVIRLFEKFFSSKDQYNALKKVATENGLIVLDHFIEGWYWGNVDEQFELAELMTHPGYGEIWREAELAHCCQPNLKDYFVQQKIELLKFSDLLNK